MDDIATLTLVGGHLALDLVNTVERGIPMPGTAVGDALRTRQDAVAWAVRVGALGVEEAATSEPRSLTSLIALRDATYAITRAALGELDWSDAEVVASLDILDVARAAAARRTTLRAPAEVGGPLVEEVGTAGPHLIVDRVAVAAGQLFTGELASRIRACPVDAGGCGWVFLDRTKNHSRTWCRMADCGTQVKSRRLTERRRADRQVGR